SLSGLATHDLARVADTLALVGLRLADLADVRGCLADSLLRDATHGELVGALDREGDTGRRVDEDRVRETEGELDRAALLLHAVTGADDLEALGVALRHADDVVVDERAGQAVERPRLTLVVGAGHQNLIVLHLDLDGGGHREGELTLGALHRDLAAVDRDGHTRGDVDGKSSDTRHVRSPHVGENFPAHALLLGLTVGEKTGGGGQDGNAQAAEDLGHLGRLRVDAETGLRHALDAGDGALTVGTVLEREGQAAADAG